jgi:hypothetical protein
MAVQLKVLRSQIAAQRVADVLNAVRQRLQKAAFGRWKRSSFLPVPFCFSIIVIILFVLIRFCNRNRRLLLTRLISPTPRIHL